MDARDPNLPDDRELVSRCNRGDRAAFEILYRRHRDWVIRVSMRLIGDEAGAFDIAQETFLYLLRQLPASPGDEPFVLRAASLKSYLYPVIRNLAVTGGRQRTRRVAHGERVARHADLVRQNVIRDEPPDVAKLHERIDALPRGQREAVLLRFGDGLAIQEIATALGIPTGTVKSRLHHALRTLRDDPELRKFLPDR